MTYSFPTAFCGHGPEERAAAQRVLDSGQLTAAAEVEAFEAELAAYHGRRHAVMVNSGSSANLIATTAVKAKYALDEDTYALVPAIAWSTTYSPIIQNGIDSLLIVDVDDTWNAVVPPFDSVGSIGFPGFNRSRPRPRLLVTVPILGNPAHLPAWQAAAIPLLVDNCESLGATTTDNRPTGSYGTISTHSFFYSHQVSAWEGGAALTDDDDLATTMRLLRNHGNSGWHSPDFESSYRFELFGYNLLPMEMHAAVARVQLRRLPEMTEHRRANAQYFRDLTQSLPIVHPRVEGRPSPFGLAFTVDSNATRRRLVTALRAASIDARLPTGGSFTRHIYGLPWREANPTPNADKIHTTGLFLGNAPWPIPDLIERAVNVMKHAYPVVAHRS